MGTHGICVEVRGEFCGVSSLIFTQVSGTEVMLRSLPGNHFYMLNAISQAPFLVIFNTTQQRLEP